MTLQVILLKLNLGHTQPSKVRVRVINITTILIISFNFSLIIKITNFHLQVITEIIFTQTMFLIRLWKETLTKNFPVFYQKLNKISILKDKINKGIVYKLTQNRSLNINNN